MQDIQTEMYKRERHYVRGWIEESESPSDWRAMKARAWSGRGDYSPKDAGEEPTLLDPETSLSAKEGPEIHETDTEIF